MAILPIANADVKFEYKDDQLGIMIQIPKNELQNLVARNWKISAFKGLATDRFLHKSMGLSIKIID